MSDSSSSRSSPEPRVAAVVLAAGAGRRMASVAGGVRKQYLEVGGVPILQRAVQAFLAHPRVSGVVVVLPAEDVAEPPPWLGFLPLELVAGGEQRGDSVWAGLGRVPAGTEIVLVHDGARPFVTRDIIDRVIAAAAAGGAVAAVRVTDTIKEADEGGAVVRTPDRSRLWQAQTPQGFPLETLREVYARARAEGVAATDDAALFERYGHPVRLVQGAHENLKVTRPADLPVAEAVARALRAAVAP